MKFARKIIRTAAFFISPEGHVLEVKGSSHIGMVISNPTRFGLTKREIEDAYAEHGEPVIVPGSMGAPRYLLRGSGNRDYLSSACHGAGRQLSRGAAMHLSDKELDDFLDSFRVVTPVDFKSHDMRKRPDILEKIRAEIKQEAPFAYKEITPVIETLREPDVAHSVAEFHPLMTVKG